MLMIALDGGEYSLIDGGTGVNPVRVGNANRPMLEFYSTNGYYERGRTAAPMGDWQTFTPTQTASTGTWTGSTITTAQYMLVGKTMFLQFAIDSGNNSNATAELRFAIPGGFVCAQAWQMPVRGLDLGAVVYQVSAFGTAGGTTVRVSNDANWSVNAANGNYVRGLVFFEVQ